MCKRSRSWVCRSAGCWRNLYRRRRSSSTKHKTYINCNPFVLLIKISWLNSKVQSEFLAQLGLTAAQVKLILLRKNKFYNQQNFRGHYWATNWALVLRKIRNILFFSNLSLFFSFKVRRMLLARWSRSPTTLVDSNIVLCCCVWLLFHKKTNLNVVAPHIASDRPAPPPLPSSVGVPQPVRLLPTSVFFLSTHLLDIDFPFFVSS